MRLPSLLSLGLAITAIVAAPAQAAFPVSDTAEILRVPPLHFVALDFDGDGRVDLLSAGAQATLYLGTADGFAPGKVVTLPGADGMTVLANAELTGDAYEDTLIAFAGSGKLLLLRGRADGKPTTPPAADVYDIVAPTPGQTRPLAIGVGDVDGDGDLDAAVGFGISADYGAPPSTADAGTITILTNDGHGALTKTGPALPVNAPAKIMLLRLAGDDDPDLVVAQANKPPTVAIKVFPGAAGAGFGAPQSYSSGGGSPVSIDWGDFDEDGRIDLAVAHAYAADPSLLAPVDVLFGGPAGTLRAPVPVPGSEGNSLVVGDLDRDRHDDLYLAAGTGIFSSGPTRPAFLHGRGDGSFAGPVRATPSSISSSFYELDPVIDYLDGDDWLDVVSIGDGGYVLRYGVGPVLEPTPAVVEFAAQPVGTRSAAQTIRFVNTGPGSATGVQVGADGQVTDFPIADDRCSGRTLEIGAGCEVAVAFVPSVPGNREAFVAAAGRESGTVVASDLFGTGLPLQVAPSGGPSPTPTAVPAPTPPVVVAARPVLVRLSRRDLRFTQRFGLPGTARWTLEVPGRRAVIGRANRIIRKPGVVRVRLRLSPAGRRFLAGHGRVALRLRTSFTPVGGKPFVLTTRVRPR